jgi:signal peptidase I
MITKRSVETARTSMSWPLRLAIAGGIVVGLVLLALIVVVRTYSVPTSAMANTIMSGETVVVPRFGATPERGMVLVFRYPGDRDGVEPESEQYWLKRCVAIAGDVVEIRESRAIVNGVPEVPPPGLKFESYPEMPDAHLRTFPRGAGFGGQNWGPLRIPKKGDRLELNDSTVSMWGVFIRREGHEIENREGVVHVDGRPATSYTVERDYWFGLGDNRNNSEDCRYWGVIPYENTTGSPWIVLLSEQPGRVFERVR